MVKWIVKTQDGETKAEGTTLEELLKDGISVDHGSLSLEIEPGIWLNLLCSEWMSPTVSSEAQGWD